MTKVYFGHFDQLAATKGDGRAESEVCEPVTLIPCSGTCVNIFISQKQVVLEYLQSNFKNFGY